jgi:hypothetical protein
MGHDGATRIDRPDSVNVPPTSESRLRQNRESQRRYRLRHALAIKLAANLDIPMARARELIKDQRLGDRTETRNEDARMRHT